MAAALLLSISLLLTSLSAALCTTFTLTNSCGYMVWPGLLSSAGTPPLPTTGFALAPGELRAVDAPGTWSGRIWGRTLCGSDPASGRFSCATGDCGSGTVECAGGGAAPPATLAEFTLAGAGGNDFYDVSLVDGSNLPMVVVPQGGAGASCGATGCLVDLNGPCPADLKVVAPPGSGSDGTSIACKSACEAFGRPEFCCNGAYSDPTTCQPSPYSQFFKKACPRAYSYAYDDASSTFTCASGTANYLVVFCPSISSLKSSIGNQTPSGLPLINDTVSFLGGGHESSHASRRPFEFAVAVLAWLCTLHWLL